MGLALAGCGGYLLYLQYTATKVPSMSTFYYWVPYIFVVAGLLVACFACCSKGASKHGNRGCMTFFAVFQFLLGVASLIAGVAFILNDENKIDDKNISQEISQAGTQFQKWLYQLGLYDANEVLYFGIALTVFGSLITLAALANSYLACCARRTLPTSARQAAV
jgi:hypothetical protein